MQAAVTSFANTYELAEEAAYPVKAQGRRKRLAKGLIGGILVITQLNSI
jgi:hypothetical protein